MPVVAFLSKENFRQATPKLFAICLFLSLGSIVFGYDTGSFSGVQAIPAFVSQFGEYSPASGRYVLDAARLSLINSLAFIGKFVGTLTAGPLIERFNHRNVMFMMCGLSFTGVILEAAASHYVQFLFGRIVLYAAVGLTENAVPTYQTELVPGGMRGAVVASIQLFIAIAQLIAAIVNKVYSTYTTPEGWIIPTCIQAIWPLLIVIGLPFIPLSPRWLISKRRHDAAAQTLRKVRPQSEADSGMCDEEVRAIEAALQHNLDKGSWLELFQGTNLRRTMVATIVFTLQQFTGQSFASQYGPRFYQTVGLGSMAFTYQCISGAVSIVACAGSLIMIEQFGRRPLLICGGFAQAIFLFVMAGLGRIVNPTQDAGRGIAACVIIFQATFNATWGATPYVIAAEIGTARLREKTMAFSSTVNVVAAFIVSFTLPYLLNAPYAALGAGVGWIYGGFAVIAGTYAYFFVPETKGRTLEELDQCFDSGVSARKFSQFVTTMPTGHVDAGFVESEKELSGSTEHVPTV